MKILLACLMCLVLTASQCFAISGGPVFGSAGVPVTGTYAGVFVPVPKIDPGPPDNSLALFTLTVPKTGLASGTVAIFRNGISYSGDIEASADPDSGFVTGVISASHMQPVGTGGTTTVTEADFANGSLKARVTADTRGFALARLHGNKSRIQYTTESDNPNAKSDGPLRYRVRGFKQAASS